MKFFIECTKYKMLFSMVSTLVVMLFIGVPLGALYGVGSFSAYFIPKMKFWKMKTENIDRSLFYLDISIKYISLEIYGYMIGVDF